MAKGLALVIEDSREIADIYSATLNLAGYEAELVYDGKQALERLGALVPRLIILDMNLPQVSGHYIYKQIRADSRLNQVVVIIATANTVMADALQKELSPGDTLLVKPVSPLQLREVLNSL